jgi:hypothetical protein
MRRRLAGLLVLAAGLCLAGCRLHIEQIRLNRQLPEDRYHAIVLGDSTRGDVLALFGPPDTARYTPRELFFEYWAAFHRGNDLEFFVPSDLIPGPIDPLAIFAVPEYFFDPFIQPGEFEPTFLEKTGRTVANAGLAFAPFVGGQEFVTLHGRQTRLDRLRVVFDRETLRATHKALRLATGEYEQETLAERILLQDD